MAAESDYTSENYMKPPTLKTCTSLLVDSIRQSLYYSGDNNLDIDAEVAQIGSFWRGVANLVGSYSTRIELSDVLPWIDDYNLEATRRDGYLMHVLKNTDGYGYCICYSRCYGSDNWLTPFVHYFDSEDLFHDSLSILYWKGDIHYPGIYSGKGYVYPVTSFPGITRMQYQTVTSREYSIALTNSVGGPASEEVRPARQNRVLRAKYSDVVIGDEVSDGVIDEIRELIYKGEGSIYKAWHFNDKFVLRGREGFKAVKVRYLDDGPLRFSRIVLMFNTIDDKRRVDLRMFQNTDEALKFLSEYYGKKATEDWFRVI